MPDMKKIYILLDDDPAGGYYAAQDWLPDMSLERSTIREVRSVDMPQATWDFILLEGGAPVDEMPDGSTSNDSTWLTWWPDGKTIWSRS
jgi:hypothetical protein